MKNTEHPLEIWRKREGIPSKRKTAQLIGMLPSQYGDVVVGRTYPSASRMRDIYEVTDGAVTPNDLALFMP